MENKNEQVFQLYMEKLSGSITPEGETLLQEMLAGDPGLASFYRTLEKEADEMLLHEFPEKADAGEGLDALKMVIRARSRRRIYRRTLSVAAVLLIVLAGIWLLRGRTRTLVGKDEISAAVEKNQSVVSLQTANGQSVVLGAAKPIVIGNTTLHPEKDKLQYGSSEDTAQNTLSVPAGENYKLVLSDGTEITLNAATRLRFPFKFGAATRDVYLDGEAYFKVAADARRPFVVHTPLTRIDVLGTSFNVNSYEKDRVKTSLVEGKVSTKSDDGNSMLLSPGFAADYERSRGFRTGKFDEDDELSWIGGVYYFHDMPIADLVRMASRCYGIHILIDESKFSGRSLSGLMDRHKLSEFLSDMETTIQAKFRYSDKNLYLE